MKAAVGETAVQRMPAVAGDEVAEALDGGERAEGGAAQAFGGEVGDGGVFGGLDAADADAGEHEANSEDRQGRAGEREHQVAGAEGGGAGDEHLDGAAASPWWPAGTLIRVAAML
jgi:hypothetical protein